MRSAAAAFAWEFRRQYRWGWVAVAAYIAVTAGVRVAAVVRGAPIVFASDDTLAMSTVVPFSFAMMFVLAVFTFGMSGDVAGRRSIFPTRFFTLPVSDAALTSVPMIYGAATMLLLWTAARTLAPIPPGLHVPVYWPAALAVSFLAWAQALTWMPYGLPFARVVAAILWLQLADSVVLLALHFEATEAQVLAIVVPQIPLAWLVARVAVARARRGVVPDWRRTAARHRDATARPEPFASAAHAQSWYEWRQHGRSLPAAVAMVLPFELALLPTVGDNTHLFIVMLLGILVTPPFIAAFTATGAKTPGADADPAQGLGSFLAVRPATSDALVSAKLRMTARSTAVAWVVVLVMVPLGVRLTGSWSVAERTFADLRAGMGLSRTLVLAGLVVGGFVVATWRQLVQSMYVGLSGRAWVRRLSLTITLLALCFIGPVANVLATNRSLEGALWDALPLLAAVFVALKIGSGTWVFTQLYRRRLVTDRDLVARAALWSGSVVTLYALLAWFLSTPFLPRYVLMLLAIMALPLTRLAAAPLALAWNRHR